MPTETPVDTTITALTIDVPEADLVDLRDRLARTRWQDELPNVGRLVQDVRASFRLHR